MEKIGDELEIHYKTPFKDKPSVTPNYGPIAPDTRRFSPVFLTSNEPSTFRLKVDWEVGRMRPADFSFIALK